jgi:hypothetical protein
MEGGMNPSDLDRFLGVWRATPGAPMSDHTFTWRWDGVELNGRWQIDMPDSPQARAAAAAGKPTSFEMPVGRAWLDDGVILFHSREQGFACEFRLVDADQAVVGMAVHKLEGALDPGMARSIEGHRVTLHREHSIPS